MMYETSRAITPEELEHQHAAELPSRSLFIGISVLGIPIVSLDGLSVNVSLS